MRTGTRAILVVVGGLASGFVVVAALLAIQGHGWTAQIRLDTGDLRYTCLGVGVISNPMPEPERSILLSLADESPVLHPQWRTCAVFPRRAAGESDKRCRDAYRRISAWAREDRTIARLALEDMAEYIDATGVRFGAPACAAILGPDLVDSTAGDILPNWRENGAVREYCEVRGYALEDEPSQSQPARRPAAQSRPAAAPVKPPDAPP